MSARSWADPGARTSRPPEDCRMKPWRSEMRRISERIAILLFAGSLAAAVKPAEWRQELIDPTANGRFSSLRIDANGNAHIAYWDGMRNQLKYSFWDHDLQKWFTQALDASGGYLSLALDSKGHPHISYMNYSTPTLKYAYWDGSSWKKQTVHVNAKDISFYSSIALDRKDNPRISFYAYWGTGDNYLLHLRNVSWNGQYWEAATVDSTPGSGKMNSIATDLAGIPHIAYANVTSENASLRYA